jgi:hypothetical protein
MELAWGKNKHWLLPLVNGKPDKTKAIALYTPVDGTLQLTPTKGDKQEALIEGGETEAVKYKKNKHQVVFEVRQGNEDGTPRKKPIEDNDGVIEGEYQYLCQPENAKVEGIRVDRCIVSCEDSLNMSDGGRWKYTIDALKPSEGNTVKWEVITDPTADAAKTE